MKTIFSGAATKKKREKGATEQLRFLFKPLRNPGLHFLESICDAQLLNKETEHSSVPEAVWITFYFNQEQNSSYPGGVWK